LIAFAGAFMCVGVILSRDIIGALAAIGATAIQAKVIVAWLGGVLGILAFVVGARRELGRCRARLSIAKPHCCQDVDDARGF
jgi:hypothetical protein